MPCAPYASCVDAGFAKALVGAKAELVLEAVRIGRIGGEGAHGHLRVGLDTGDEGLDIALTRSGGPEQVDDVIEVGAQWNLHGYLCSLRPIDDRGVTDGIRGHLV